MSVLPLLLAVVFGGQPMSKGLENSQRIQLTEAKPLSLRPTPRQLDWQALETYAFLHFTTNTFTDKEWGYGDESPSVFDPKEFSAKQIISSLKAGGMKAVILTCKHHDGFCLWPTKTTGHNITASPYRNGKGDIVREISDECRRQGLKFGVYLSPWDRNHPLYGKPEYVTQVYREQLRELLTQYGPIFQTWHDGANGGDGYYGGAREVRQIDRNSYYDWPGTWNLIRQLQPNAVIWSDVGPDARWVGTEAGFAGDPCWHTITIEPGESVGQIASSKLLSGNPEGTSWIPAEVDFSIRPGWFWHEAENARVKSPAQLMKHYLDSVGRGANMLLNVPPDRCGLVHELDKESLRIFGQHLKKTFAKDLAHGSGVTASSTRSGSRVEAVLDRDPSTGWFTAPGERTGELVLDLGRAKSFNLIRVREPIAEGQRIRGVAVDAWQGDEWVEIAKSQMVGSCRMWRVPKTTTGKIRVRITDSTGQPGLSEVGLFLEPPVPTWSPADAAQIPGRAKVLRATASYEAEGSAAANLIDGDSSTLWHTHSETRGESGLPQWAVLDLGSVQTVTGLAYLPRQDGVKHGMVDRYELYVSKNGRDWGSAVKTGEIGNLRANPVEQVVLLDRPMSARYVKFVATRSLERNHAAIAGLSVLVKE